MKYRTHISTMVSLPGRIENYLETPRNASFSCLSCLLLVTSLTLTVLTLSTPQFIPSSGVLSSSSVFQLCQVFCRLWSYTKNVFFVLLPRLCAAVLATQKALLWSCSSQPKLGPRRTVNPLAFHDLSPLYALSISLQSAGLQKLDQPWRVAGLSYGVLGHAQHRACRASLLVERNPNNSFLKVVMRQWFKVLFSIQRCLNL